MESPGTRPGVASIPLRQPEQEREGGVVRTSLASHLRLEDVFLAVTMGLVGPILVAVQGSGGPFDVEHASAPAVSITEMARLLAVVGLELSSRAYPAGPPIRDTAHLALLERLRRVVPLTCAGRYEVPMGMPGNRRAWDAVLTIAGGEVAVEAETRLRDLQSLLRRIAGKLRDSHGLSVAILLLSNTRHNRRLLVDHGDVIASAFPAPGTEILRVLGVWRAASAERSLATVTG